MTPANLLIKILLIGDSGAGKSCVLLRYSDGKFDDRKLCTVGIDFKVKSLDIDDQKVRLQIWDSAGQERFKTITQAYYRSAMGIMLVFDINNPASFENARSWMEQIQMHASPNVSMILVGNKSDLPPLISQHEINNLTSEIGCPYVCTSAKTGVGVEEAFNLLARSIVKRQEKKSDEEQQTTHLLNRTPKNQNCCF